MWVRTPQTRVWGGRRRRAAPRARGCARPAAPPARAPARCRAPSASAGYPRTTTPTSHPRIPQSWITLVSCLQKVSLSVIYFKLTRVVCDNTSLYYTCLPVFDRCLFVVTREIKVTFFITILIKMKIKQSKY